MTSAGRRLVVPTIPAIVGSICAKSVGVSDLSLVISTNCIMHICIHIS